MKLAMRIFLLLLTGLPAFAMGAGRTATMQVSFVIEEVCEVDVRGSSFPSASVRCNRDTPYRIRPAGPQVNADPGSGIGHRQAVTGTSPQGIVQEWMIYF